MVPFVVGVSDYDYRPIKDSFVPYAPMINNETYSSVNIGPLIMDIMMHRDSPAWRFTESYTFPGQLIAIADAMIYAKIHDAIYIESKNVQ